MSISYNTSVITDGLIWAVDPSNTKSYSGSGTNIKNIISGSSNTLSGTSYSYDTASYAVPVLTLNNNGTDSTGAIACSITDMNALALTYNFTVMFAAKKNYYGLAGNSTGNSQLFVAVPNGYGMGWRIGEWHGGTPGAAFSSAQGYSFGFNDQFTSLNANDSTGSTNRMSIVAFTVSPTTITGFNNGTTSTRTNPRTYVSGTSSPYISSTQGGMGSFNGLLGFFMIYNRALSSTEILQNYNALRGRYGL